MALSLGLGLDTGLGFGPSFGFGSSGLCPDSFDVFLGNPIPISTVSPKNVESSGLAIDVGFAF